jgi:hypothetical protein
VIIENGYSKFLRKVHSLQEKAESEQQQKLFGLALSVKRGETPRSEVSDEVLKIVDSMSEKEIRKFAKTKHEGIPKKVQKEETECGSEKKNEIDRRPLATAINLAKNKARAMGAKNPLVMVASENIESGPILPGEKGRRVFPKGQEPKATGAKLPLQKAHFEPEGEVIDERRREDKGKERGPEPSDAFKEVAKSMGAGRLGVQPRGQRKKPGKKPPAAGEYGGPESPAQKVAKLRADAQRAREFEQDTRGT